MAPKAIFLDIDGTLVIKRKGPFPEDTDMIAAAHQGGHKIFLSTGRSLGHIPPELQEAPWLDGIIAGAGAHVVIRGKTVYHKWAPREILLPICDYYLKAEKFCVFEGENGVFGINLPDRFTNTENILPITDVGDFINRYPDALISKLTLGGQPTDPERLLLSDFFQINAFPNYFEGIILGESKSKGMGIILQNMGIPRENTIAIGDSANDIDIICTAALGIAMGNASEELKALAGAITGNCGEGGVGQAIKRFVLDAD